MPDAPLFALALLAMAASLWAVRSHRRLRTLQRVLHAAGCRESGALEAVRVLVAASRESTAAVLVALERLLQLLDPSLDALLVFAGEGEELACIHAAGARTEHFLGTRLRRDHPSQLPAQAAARGHRVDLAAAALPVIPTDRAALAIPMYAGDALCAVVYAATTARRLRDPDALVRAVAQAAAPYALAAERETDRHKATYDALTGLYSPRAFREMLAAELCAARVSRRTALALWFIDTDHFKRVNDTLGHAAGDAVLQRMAALLREHTLEGVDWAARNGGDEFCAVVRNVHKMSAIERAQRFCEAVRACDFGIDGAAITASVGVAAFPYDADDASALLEAADAAMYHSKRCGRDRVSFAAGRAQYAVYG